MPSVSSPLAPKGPQLMTKRATAVLLALLSVVLFASSGEARGLRAHGNSCSSSKPRHPPGKQDVATSSMNNGDGWQMRQTEARSTAHTAIDDRVMAQADVKAKDGVAMESSNAAATAEAMPVVRVSQRLSRREDAGFHLDYAGPRTHTPSHN